MNAMPHVDGVEHRRVRARGLEFHVAEAGSGEDAVLCLHGWPQHWYEWRHLLPGLADRHRVLAPDLRGFGWSDAPRDASSATWRSTSSRPGPRPAGCCRSSGASGTSG